jgi:hypothetical protein
MSHPLLYELNTRCWLRELGARAGQPITLANVPEAEFAQWLRLGFTHIWLMGVWTGGPRGREEALTDANQRRHYSEALPDWQEADVAGSPYAIAEYRVPAALGGEAGLAQFRRQLQARGLKLVLDFVPNHLGLEHPWLRERPELFVQSPKDAPEGFAQETRQGLRWLAHGKDPFFPAWTDTVQLDYRREDTRREMTGLLCSVAERCDGVRCDMAMLLLADVFAKTWERFPGSQTGQGATPAAPKSSGPIAEFWTAAIGAVRQAHPGFVFLAEVYWGLDVRLQKLGFDYTYDKELYDRLVSHDPAGVQRHLLKLKPEVLAAGAHFLENHDERRIATVLSPPEHRAAALLCLGLPGMRFLHEGQLAGAKRRLPVQLGRRCGERAQPEVESLYRDILRALPKTAVGQGKAELLKPRNAWPENPTAEDILLVQWQRASLEFDLVAVNLAPHRSQCYAPLTVAELSAHDWEMQDLLGSEHYLRYGVDLQQKGLYLDLPGYAAQLFQFRPKS